MDRFHLTRMGQPRPQVQRRGYYGANKITWQPAQVGVARCLVATKRCAREGTVPPQSPLRVLSTTFTRPRYEVLVVGIGFVLYLTGGTHQSATLSLLPTPTKFGFRLYPVIRQQHGAQESPLPREALASGWLRDKDP